MKNTYELKEYLRALSSICNNDFEYSSIYEFTLRNGEEYEITKLPKGVTRGPLGNCFQNVQEIILNDIEGRYTYVEGFAFSITIPMMHAWLFDKKNNHAFDPTWTEGIAYIGCEFPTDYVRGRILEHKHYMSMIDNWMGQFPLLTGEHAYPIERGKE